MRLLLRLGVSAALMVFVLIQSELAQIGTLILEANFALIGCAFLAYFVSYFTSVSRWKLLLSVHGGNLGFGYLYASSMIGMFFNQILPTTIGGDVMRYQYTSGAGRGAALSAILMDRVLGAVSLMLVALAGLFFAARVGAVPEHLLEAIVLLLMLGLVSLGVVFLVPRSRLDALRSIHGRIPASIGNFVERLFAAFAPFRGRRDVLVKSLIWSLLLQVTVVGHYYLVALAVGLAVPLGAFVLFVPLAIAIMMLPISINGIGVRESVFVYLFGLYGAPPAESITFSWLVYAVIVAQGLVGGVVFATMHPKKVRAVG